MVVELIVVGPKPLESLHLFAGTAAVDPAFGLRSVLDGGATQILDAAGETLATVFRSRGIEVPSEILRLTGESPRHGWTFWTEAYVPDSSPRGMTVVEAIAAEAGSVVVRPGVGRVADVRGGDDRGSVSG